MVHILDRALERRIIRVRMSSIRCFRNFLERVGIVGVNPMASVDIPKAPLRYPEVSLHDLT